jgi:hypothetical protein
LRRSLLEDAHRVDDLERHPVDARPADREVVDRALGLRPPVAGGVDLDRPERVGLGAELGHLRFPARCPPSHNGAHRRLPPMEIARATEGTYDAGDAARFTGHVSLRAPCAATTAQHRGRISRPALGRTGTITRAASSSMRSPVGAGPEQGEAGHVRARR